MSHERRSHERVSVVWKATIIRLNGEHLPGSTDNVSVDGLNVILSKELVLGEPVSIDLVTQSGLGIGYYRLQGRAVYVTPLADNLGVAVGFELCRVSPRYGQMIDSLTGESRVSA